MLKLNSNEPECFTSFKIKNKPHSYQDDCNNYELRLCLRKALLEEQQYQCFYCEKKIENDTSKIHIDHIKQRNVYHELECEYSNMALSCNDDNHCGKYKDKQGIWDDNKFLRIISENPQLREEPSDFFIYMSNGKVTVKKSLIENEKERAINTIEYLNLNHKDLVSARKTIFSQLKLYQNSGLKIDEIYTCFNEFENLFKGN
ncbi:MAG TPA: TIGR02646 family protein [Campylobacterales bacterium]|nr:TIGR02646 family protein [Campylobacterales bacterium]